MTKSSITRSYSSYIFSFLRNWKTLFWSVWTTLHSHQQSMNMFSCCQECNCWVVCGCMFSLIRDSILISTQISNVFSSVQLSRSVVSDSLQPHELQHTRPPCPTTIPGAYPNSCPLSWWCHPTISSSVVPVSSCLQSFPASGSFQMGQLFASVAKVLQFQLQHQIFQWAPRTDLL